MAIKEYSAFPKSLASLETYHQIVSSHYRTLIGGESYPFAEKQSVYSTAPADWARCTLFFVWHESSDWWPLWVQQWIVDCSHTCCPSKTLRQKIWGGGQIRLMRRPLGFVAPADQPIRESIVEPLHRDVGCMWSCHILLEPLHISIHTITYSKCHPELVQHINVTLLCDCLIDCVFKPKRSDYSIFWVGYAFYWVQGSLKHLVWCFCAPEHTVIAINMSTESEVCFIAEPNLIKEVRILFNLILEQLAQH